MVLRNRWAITVAAVGSAAFAFVFATSDALRAGGENPPDALVRARVPADVYPSAAAAPLEAHGFAANTPRRVAQDTYLIEQKDHGEELICIMSTHRNHSAGGCNPKSSFFAGRSILWGIDQDGGPSTPSALWISGVAKPEIAFVRARFGGVVLSTSVTKDGGFFIEATPQALAEGRPSILEGVDAKGEVISSIPLPKS